MPCPRCITCVKHMYNASCTSIHITRRTAAVSLFCGMPSWCGWLSTELLTRAVAMGECGELVTGKNPMRVCSCSTPNFCGNPNDRQSRVQAQQFQSQARQRYSLEATPEGTSSPPLPEATRCLTRRAQVMAGSSLLYETEAGRWPAHVPQCWSDRTVHEALCYCKSDMSAAAGSCHQLEQREAETHWKLGERGASGSSARSQRAQ